MKQFETEYNKYRTQDQEARVGTLDRTSFVKKTYQLFAASLMASAAGSYVGVPMAAAISSVYWFIAIPWLLFGMFGLQMVKDKPGINYIALFAFTFAGGIIATPTISYVLGFANGASLVANAFISTSILFGGLSIYAMNAKADFSSWGKPLLVSFVINCQILIPC